MTSVVGDDNVHSAVCDDIREIIDEIVNVAVVFQGSHTGNDKRDTTVPDRNPKREMEDVAVMQKDFVGRPELSSLRDGDGECPDNFGHRCRCLEEVQGRTVEYIDLNPPGCPSAVLTVTLVGSLLSQLSSAQQQLISSMDVVPEMNYQVSPVDVVDAHCHLHQLLQRVPSWMRSGCKELPDGLGRVAVLVNNCVFRSDWDWVPPGSSGGLRVVKTVGVYPRLAGECVPWTKLEQLMLRSECAAIGECGLDETAVNREDPDAGMEEQEALLKKHLDVAKRSRKPLVFHVRGRTDETTQKLFGKTAEHSAGFRAGQEAQDLFTLFHRHVEGGVGMEDSISAGLAGNNLAQYADSSVCRGRTSNSTRAFGFGD